MRESLLIHYTYVRVMASSAVPYVHLSDSDEGFVPERYFDPDLDSLFMRCYTYYRDKGLVCMLLSGIFYLLYAAVSSSMMGVCVCMLIDHVHNHTIQLLLRPQRRQRQLELCS